MISICLLMQLKAQLLSSRLPQNFTQTPQIEVASLTGRLLHLLLLTFRERIELNGNIRESIKSNINKIQEESGKW